MIFLLCSLLFVIKKNHVVSTMYLIICTTLHKSTSIAVISSFLVIHAYCLLLPHWLEFCRLWIALALFMAFIIVFQLLNEQICICVSVCYCLLCVILCRLQIDFNLAALKSQPGYYRADKTNVTVPNRTPVLCCFLFLFSRC